MDYRIIQASTNIQKLVEEYRNKFEDLSKIKEFVESILQLDKGCSIDELAQSIETFQSCFTNISDQVKMEWHGQSHLIQEITGMVKSSKARSEHQTGEIDSGGLPGPGCKEINTALNCMQANECFSEQEVELFKELSSTSYKNQLKILTKTVQSIDKLEDWIIQWTNGDETWRPYKYEVEKAINDSQVIRFYQTLT